MEHHRFDKFKYRSEHHRNCESWCRVDIYTTSRQNCAMLIILVEVPGSRVIWVEHYSAGLREETWDLVALSWDKTRAKSPAWRYVSRKWVQELAGNCSLP